LSVSKKGYTFAPTVVVAIPLELARLIFLFLIDDFD